MKFSEIFLCLMLIASSTVASSAAYAQEQNQSSALTYHQAFEMAIRSNDSLRKIQNEIDQAKEMRNNLSSSFPVEARTSSPYLSTIMQSAPDLEMLAKNKKIEYDSVRDAIELELRSIFVNVQLHQENMRIASKKIQSLRDAVQIELQKRQYGAASEYDAKKLQHELDKATKEKAVSEKEVQKQYFALNKLLGQATVKYTHIVPLSLEYKPVDAQDSEHKIGLALSNSALINYKKSNIASLELKKELYPLHVESAWATNAPQPEKPFMISADIAVQADDLAIQKRNLEQQIRNLYNNLKSMEATIKAQEAQQQILAERIRIAEAQLKAGMITAKQLQDAKLQLEILNSVITDLKGKHSLMQLQFEKPHLIF